MSRQSVDEQPQTHVLTLRGGDAPAADRQLTQFPHPYPTLRGLQVGSPGNKGFRHSHNFGSAIRCTVDESLPHASLRALGGRTILLTPFCMRLELLGAGAIACSAC